MHQQRSEELNLFGANLNVPGTVKNINRPLYLLPVAGTH